ncbi:MAG: C10 family peptidase, partial [Bacteroidales bacterium]|nr:C10 family peptidase [Bacteroidales bacterium]
LTFVLGQLVANPVSKQEAKTIATNFFKSNAPKTRSINRITKTIIEKHNDNNSFYIYGFEKGGFVIVSADDDASPILGYSFTSNISDNLNPSIKYLFEQFNNEISDAKRHKSRNSNFKEQWNNLRDNSYKSNREANKPILKTAWNQEPYYNALCPTGTPVGCVATAMSQIMFHHKWPASGNGWHKYIPEDHPEYGALSAEFESTTYDWDNMTFALLPTSTNEQKKAISTLCYQAGVSVNMNYGPDGSGANSSDVMYALTSYFKYDPSSIKKVTYNKDEETEYFNTIKNEIDNNRPIYYDGGGDEGGHAWICDGYDNNNKVHIHWGWGGAYDGYFLLSNMVGGDYDFTKYNSMIIGIQPGNANQEMLWTKQASGFKAKSRGIQNISAIDERTAWAVSYDGSGDKATTKDFTRTTDGYTWKSGEINATDTDGLSSAMISAVSKDIAWVALFDGTNGGGKIVKTSDGGKNWITQSSASFTAPNGFPNIVHFWDKNNGFCQGDPNDGYFEIYTTSNGGENWNRVSKANIPSNLDKEYGTIGRYAVYGNNVWFATNKGRIYKSTDKGLNWVVYKTPISDASFELSFKDENIGIIQAKGENNQTAYITNNGGETWNILNYTGNFYKNSFKFIPNSDLLITTGADLKTPSAGISYSTDNGSTFTDYAEFYQNYQILAIGSTGTNAIWAGAYNSDENNDGMWRYGNSLFTADFTTDKTDYCSEEVTFNEASFGNPDSWTWNFGEGATPETAEGKGPHKVNYSSKGYKTITLTAKKGSNQHELIKENSIHISTSTPVISTITGETSVNINESHSYTVEKIEKATYNWEIPNNWKGTSETNSVNITFTSQGTSNIKVTPKNACGIGSSVELEITVAAVTGIDDFEKNILTIYPNPTKDVIIINGINNVNLTIYNSAGKTVKTINNYQENQTINVSDLEPGIYFVRVLIKNKIISKTISIVK